MIDITPHMNLAYKILGQQPDAVPAAAALRGAPAVTAPAGTAAKTPVPAPTSTPTVTASNGAIRSTTFLPASPSPDGGSNQIYGARPLVGAPANSPIKNPIAADLPASWFGAKAFSGMKDGEVRMADGMRVQQYGAGPGSVQVMSNTPSAPTFTVRDAAKMYDDWRLASHMTPSEAAAALNAVTGGALSGTKAGLMPDEVAATNALTNAQARSTNTTADWLPKTLAATIAEMGSRTGLNNASATKARADAANINSDTSSNDLGLSYLKLLGPKGWISQ